MKKLDLTGRWTLATRNNEHAVTARLPGDTISALLAARRIPDPYWADKEGALQWIGREDWVYERTFRVPAALLKEDSVFLHADSIDTVARVFINGQCAATTDNMFVRVRAEVKPLLRPGVNTIRVEIESPEKRAALLASRLPYPVPHTVYPVQSRHRNLLRKVQCHAGWDWGPCLMVSGIYGAFYLGATSLGRIEYVATTQRHARRSVAVDVEVEVLSPSGGDSLLEIELGDARHAEPAKLVPGTNRLKATVRVTDPRLWWPNGYGGQPLYPLVVRVGGDEVRKRIGLRTIEVVTTPDKHGVPVTFRVNGVDIFAKGANWIPCDALPQRQSREVLDGLLSSAARAHMNMLRVWGGGQYESADFYELCDEKGLLVWQDFMFACALYPATPDFLESVGAEVRHQVRRLRDHACIALWCGNNENVGALNWFEESRRNRDRYVVDYDRLNEGVIGRTVGACDPTRLFWPSSPCGGRGDYSDCFHVDNRGDMHCWTVWHEGKPFEAYHEVAPRFCSEFGFQSFPALETIKTFAPPEQWNVTAPVMEWHQRHPNGNTRIVETFARYFRMPDRFADFVYLSQVQQAVAIQTAVEHWRRQRPRCMGALYWQLNDVWPVCSWSSLDYGGKWKLLHHAARRFFAPVALSVRQDADGGVEVWGVNDRREPVRGTARAELRDFSGRVLRAWRLAVRLPAGRARRLVRWNLAGIAPHPETVFLQVEFDSSRATHFFAPFKRCELAEPRIRMKTLPGLRVRLETDRPAFFVRLNADGIRGEFDDNAFTLLPGRPRTLVFTPEQDTTLRALKASLSVCHLRGTYA
jgi:beta-mannosidase